VLNSNVFHQAPCPDAYRGIFRDNEYTPEELGKKYADEVKGIIKAAHDSGRNIAAYIAESLQSCGGQVILPPGYLRQVYR
jgi:ethanolamine-phosphate phospho-lyase